MNTEPRKQGGVTVFLYTVLARGVRTVRSNTFQQNVLLLLVAAYLIIALQVLHIARFDGETVEAIVGTLEVSDLVLVVPALTLGPWATTIVVIVVALAFSQFLANGFERRSELSRSRVASLVVWTIVVLLVGLFFLSLVPIPVALIFFAMVLLVARAPRSKQKPRRMGSRDHQSSRHLTMRAVLYSAMFGWDTLPDDREAQPQDDHVDVHASEMLSEYFDPGDDTYRARQALGLLLVLLVVLSLGWNFFASRSWIPTEAVVIQPEGVDEPAYSALHQWVKSTDSSASPDTHLLVGHIFEEGSQSTLMLTTSSRPKMVRIPTSWIAARSLCQPAQAWWQRSLISAPRYDTCP